MPADVKDLMQRYCAGDASAFRELYNHAAPSLRGYLMRLCGQAATADDLLQVTFLKVHRARAAFVAGADPMPWMFSIAHRTFLDEARRRKRAKVALSATDELPEIPVHQSGQTDAQLPDDGPPPEQTAAAIAALQHLPANQREAVVLTKLSGKTVAEAAAIAGTSVGAMKVRAHRGYEMLRKLLKVGTP